MGGEFNGRLVEIKNVKPIKMGKQFGKRVKYTFDSWIDEDKGLALYKTK